MRNLKISCEPHEKGVRLFRRGNLEINEGITIFVGCNGCGKTTMLRLIYDYLCHEKTPVLYYNNLEGESRVQKKGMMGDLSFLATAWGSSEGEKIVLNLGDFASEIYNFIHNNGKVKNFDLSWAYEMTNTKPKESDKEAEEFWILMDAVDSGLSLDNIQELKGLLHKVQKDVRAMGKRLYILISANSYELCRGDSCFDVRNGTYLTFKDYEEYRTFIMNSRLSKDKRCNRNRKQN